MQVVFVLSLKIS